MIAILGAMECEITLLLSKMQDVTSERIGRHTYHRGRIGGQDCVLARCGVGLVNAAVSATVMIEHYHPDMLINIGVGGGLAPDLSVGEVIAAESLCTHDLKYGVLGDERGMVFYPDGEAIKMLPADKNIREAILRAAAELGIKCRAGVIASGDMFVSDSETRRDIREAFLADICEMEGAAVAQTAYAFGTPFAVLRSVSDLADGTAPESFERFAAASADTAAAILERAIEYLCK